MDIDVNYYNVLKKDKIYNFFKNISGLVRNSFLKFQFI